MPEEMGFGDLRRGTDVEFGLSLYEPFGIALLEPLNAGALCVVSDACGCLGFVDRVAGGAEVPAVVRAEFVRRVPAGYEAALAVDAAARQRLEGEESRRAALVLAERLERRRGHEAEWLARGNELAGRMSWERVVEEYFLPALARL
jgi:hypothetical protein